MWAPLWLLKFLLFVAKRLQKEKKGKLLNWIFRACDISDDRVYFALRRRILLLLGAKIGERSRIKRLVTIDSPENIVIGDNVSINQGSYLSCYGGLRIGNDVSIAHDVSIMTTTHPYRNSKQIKMNTLESSEVRIGSNVWIGMKAMILYGVTIGDDVVIAAGTLVNKNVETNSVVGGVPAKRIGSVFDDNKSSEDKK